MGGDGQKTAVLVPMKPFALAKSRLSTACTQSQREHIARAMARNVLKAATGLRTAVVGPAEATDIRRFALINGARFFSEPKGEGLNSAITQGVFRLRELGYDRVAVVMSDLPLVRDLSWLANDDGITVVTDRTGQGTNAISLPADIDFDFSFGPGSYERHQAEVLRHGHNLRAVTDPDGISADVDDLDDAMRHGVFLDPITQENTIIDLGEYESQRRTATDR